MRVNFVLQFQCWCLVCQVQGRFWCFGDNFAFEFQCQIFVTILYANFVWKFLCQFQCVNVNLLCYVLILYVNFYCQCCDQY
jgi:hypothetical protein